MALQDAFAPRLRKPIALRQRNRISREDTTGNAAEQNQLLALYFECSTVNNAFKRGEFGLSYGLRYDLRHARCDEHSNGEVLYTFQEASIVIEQRQTHSNIIRPQSSLDYQPSIPEIID